MNHPTTRDVPVETAHTTLLFIDVQNYCCAPGRRRIRGHVRGRIRIQRYGYYFREMERRVLPNMQRLQAGCRAAGIEVMYTLIRNLTRDGRDRSLDYKITGFNVPPDSWDGQMIDAISAGAGRDRAAEDLLQRVRLHQHRLRAAQSRHAIPGDLPAS